MLNAIVIAVYTLFFQLDCNENCSINMVITNPVINRKLPFWNNTNEIAEKIMSNIIKIILFILLVL